MPRPLLSSISSRPRVALLIETSMASGRQILKGIARYARENGPWATYHEPGHMLDRLPEWLSRWDGQGVIARVRTPALARALSRLRCPVVDVLNDTLRPRFPAVQVSNEGLGQLAAAHFLERGFHHFGFCEFAGPLWARLRRKAFEAAIRSAGHRCAVFRLPRRETTDWFSEAERERLADWVRSLPKPAAIFACNDLAGQRVLDACRRADAAVPEMVAVLGVDNDESLCEVADPMLSSIVPVHDQVGYQAAQMLDGFMRGKPARRRALFLQPTEIVVRRSTDVLAIDDVDVASAVRFIREQACLGIGVHEVVEHVAISYSTLKRRFARIFGRSIHAEIVRTRLDRAKELLAGTDLPLATIARKTGFEHQEYLGAVFKAQTGQTPHRYRMAQRLAGQ